MHLRNTNLEFFQRQLLITVLSAPGFCLVSIGTHEYSDIRAAKLITIAKKKKN